MKNIPKQQIKEAATAFAKKELGEEQFKTNPDAVKALEWSFTEGVKWLDQAPKKVHPEVSIADLKLTTQADLFYCSQPTPTDHAEMMVLIAEFAGQFAGKLLKKAGEKAAEVFKEYGANEQECDDLHDELTDLIDQYRG